MLCIIPLNFIRNLQKIVWHDSGCSIGKGKQTINKKSTKTMKTLQIEESKAKELYKTASSEFKAMLEDSFGKSFFEDDWMELWEKWQKKHKLNIVLPFSHPKTPEEKSSNAHHMLIHIVPIERGKFNPDYDKDGQWKYEPRFYMGSSGFGFSGSDYVDWRANAICGSRLCSPNPNVCKRIAEEFLPIYKVYTMYQTK